MARPRSDISLRIVHAARRRFLDDGVDGASLRQIARDAGTSIGMVYYYFQTKDDLFGAVVEEIYAALLGDLAKALAPDAPFEERLQRMYLRFAAMTEEEHTVARMVIRELLVSSSRLDRLIERFSRGHLPLVLATLRDGIASGEVSTERHPIAAAIAMMALGLLPQIVRRLVGDRTPPGFQPPVPEVLARELAGVLLEGIGRPVTRT